MGESVGAGKRVIELRKVLIFVGLHFRDYVTQRAETGIPVSALAFAIARYDDDSDLLVRYAFFWRECEP